MMREYVVKVTDALIPDAFQRFENEWSPEQEIVRCEECKHWLPMNRFDPDFHPGRGQCELNCWVRDFDWYCADGERR